MHLWSAQKSGTLHGKYAITLMMKFPSQCENANKQRMFFEKIFTSNDIYIFEKRLASRVDVEYSSMVVVCWHLIIGKMQHYKKKQACQTAKKKNRGNNIPYFPSCFLKLVSLVWHYPLRGAEDDPLLQATKHSSSIRLLLISSKSRRSFTLASISS